MDKIRNWKTKRSGDSTTITGEKRTPGEDEEWTAGSVTGIVSITGDTGDGIIATDKKGVRYNLLA